MGEAIDTDGFTDDVDERRAAVIRANREAFERLAAGDGPFSDRAQRALDWLADYEEGDDE